MASVAADTGDGATRSHRLLFLLVAVGWLALDQLTKSWAASSLRSGPVDVVWTLRFDLTHNSGASFSMGTGLGPWIAIGAVVIIGVLLWARRSMSTRLTAVSLGLITGGALGNVCDRAFRGGSGFFGGSVIDFIDLQWWPVFNVADIGVVCGAILLVIATFRSTEP